MLIRIPFSLWRSELVLTAAHRCLSKKPRGTDEKWRLHKHTGCEEVGEGKGDERRERENEKRREQLLLSLQQRER